MATSRRSGRSRFTLILLILTSITLVTLDYRGFEPFDGIRDGALGVFAPVRDAADGVVSPVSDAWNGAFGYGDLEAENEDLREQVAELEGTVTDAERDRDMLRDILGELNIPYVGDIPRELAEVVAGPVNNFDHTIEIDKGTDHGIEVGMTVVNQRGMVGRVERASDNRSVVQLVTDTNFRVGVQLGGSQTVGVARGQGRGQDLIVDTGISPDVVVGEGELVTTSGQERSLFPSGINIGRVDATNQPRGELEQNVFVRPFVDFDALTFVSVLLWEPNE